MSDDAQVQDAITTRTRLLPGTYTITQPIVLGPGQSLRGSGSWDTVILPGAPGMMMVHIQGTSVCLKDLHIGVWDDPTVMSIGLYMDGLYDRALIDNVWFDGLYDTSTVFLAGGAASSSIRHSAFWNYQSQKFTAIFDRISDWSNFQVEYHQQSPVTSSAVIWMTGTSAIRFFGGNTSCRVGSGCPGYINQDNVNYTTPPPGPNSWYNTTFYQEPAPS